MARSALLKLCQEEHSWPWALRLYEGQDLFALSGAVTALAAASRWRQALQLFAAAKRRDVVSYTAALAAVGGLWELALSWLKQMEHLAGEIIEEIMIIG